MHLELNSKFYDSCLFSKYLFPKYEFHISREMRKKYDVTEEFFSISGNVIFANNPAVRNLLKI